MAVVTVAAITAVGIVAVATISAAATMAAGIFTPDRAAHSPRTVHSPHIA